ncbi:MAG TPA: choice-of-anchor R domain-containing protein [Rhizomicrobium sp.]|jgi:hypothetical protein
MITKTILVLAAATFLANSSMAAPIDGITLSEDGRTAVFSESSGYLTTPPVHEAGTKTLFSNIGTKYPKGEYFCCFGDTISGPDSVVGSQNWAAAQFASADDAIVTEIDVAAEWAGGTNEITINLYADKGGVPGKLLKTFKATGLEGVSTCCAFAVGKDKTGIAIKGGRPYWVALTTGDPDTFAIWVDNSTDQIHGLPLAGNTGTGWLAAGYQIPQLSFGVFGK